MSPAVPEDLLGLLRAPDAHARAAAWAAFLEQHSALILHVVRSRDRDPDAIMSAYEFILDQLQRHDYARLRRYSADGKGKLSTWLIVVVGRLCVDHHRQQYGRLQSNHRADRHAERRQLADLLGGDLGLEQVEADAGGAPDVMLLRSEKGALLGRALASLTPSDRLLLRLRYEDDLSVPSIARALGEASPFVVYRRLDRVLASLRHLLEGYGVRDSL